MDSRIARRRAQVRRQRMRRRRRRTVIAVLVGLLIAGAMAIERSALVALAEVEVAGTRRITAETVREAAALPLGTSTLRLDLGTAERRVEALAWVEDADIRRRDPLTVSITVRERRPAMTLTTPGGTALIDAEGVVLDRGKDDGLPVLALAAGRPPEPGERVTERPAADNALRVYRGLPGPLRAEVNRVDAREPDEAELVLRSGTVVRFGRADRVDEKARALGALLADVQDARTIDVRAPSNPVVIP